MSNSSPFTIVVSTVLNNTPTSGVDVSSISADLRTLTYTGTAGDQVEVWGSADGTNFAPIGITMTGPRSERTINDRSRFYATRRLVGTTSGSLKCVGADFQGASGSIGGGVFIYRAGETNPSGNVYNTLAAALSAASAIPGSTVVVDDSLSGPTTEALTYDWQGITLAGTSLSGAAPTLQCIDGTVFTNLARVVGVDVLHLGTAPLITTPAGTYVLELEGGATLEVDATATAAMISVSATTTFFGLVIGGLCSIVTGGALRVISAIAGSTSLISVLPGGTVGATTITGAGTVDVEVSSPAVSQSQAGAAAITYSYDEWSLPAQFNFNADGMVGLTNVSNMLPPGSRLLTVLASVATPYILAAGNGQLHTFEIRFTGDAANVAGQTVQFTLNINGSAVGTSGALATTAGAKTATVTVAAGQYVKGDQIDVRFLPSANLAATLTGISASAR